MTRRVLVCIEDTGVAHVVASRLQKDGVDGVVVDKPSVLVESARAGADALVVQDKYPSGEVGSSLLRQVRVARGEAVSAIYLLTGDLAAPDRHVLERQYRVREFLGVEATPHRIAAALREAAGDEDVDLDVILHEDEKKNDFDIEIASQAGEPVLDLEEVLGSFDDSSEERTTEVSAAEMQLVKEALERPFARGDGEHDTIAMPARKVHDEITKSAQASDPHTVVTALSGPASTDLTEATERALDEGTREFVLPPGAMDGDGAVFEQPSELPAPGGDRDFVLPDLGEVPGDLTLGDDGAAIDEQPAEAAAASDSQRGEEMQMQELKKALLAQKKAREAAEKRVKDLESRLAKVEPSPGSPGDGVPAEGVFEEVRYPALLARCRGEGFTGAIKFQIGGANTRTVYLRDGLPVGYASSEPGERIGKMMVAQGRISDEQYIKAATVMVERGIKLTEALVELGFIEGETLAVEMRNLTRDQIIQGFELTQGRFTVQEGQRADDSVATFDFGPGEIYVQGYRRYAPKQEMQALYESLRDAYLIANTRLASFRPKLGLGGDDERLLRLLGEAYTLEEAVERASVAPDHAARLIAALQALDLVEEWSPGVEQFRARLRAERQRHAEEIAAIREDMSRREQRLFEGFERALAKIGTLGGASGVNLADHLPARDEPARLEARADAGASAPAAPRAERHESITVAPRASAPVVGEVTTLDVEPDKPVNGAAAARPTIEVAPEPPAAAEPAEPQNPFGPMPEEPMSAADAKYREGIEQAAHNRLDEAEVTLREAVRMDASKPQYLLSLARVLLANPRYERTGTLPVVRSLLDRAVQIAPDHGEVKEMHGQVVAEMGG